MPRPIRYQFGAVLFFVLLHVGVVAVWWVPPTWQALAWLCGTYTLRMFGVTAGYHRYFGHRSYTLSRTGQFVMAVLAQTSAQKGVLWWAAHHRLHHRESDRDADVHSPHRRGFWWAHVGWVLSNDYDEFDPRAVRDLARYPELVWLNTYHWVPTVAFGAAVVALGGWTAFVWGYVVSTVAVYHGTFAINSLAHLWGTRRFATPDESRNNWWLALVTLGEGWHNNHHHAPGSCRQGHRWWELDLTYLGLKALSWVGVTSNLRPLPRPRGVSS